MKKDLAASVRARLLSLAKAEQSDFNQVLVRYALERLLYRISVSAYSDQFLLKGALLFTLWYAMPHRPTRDVDLLGFGASDLQTIGDTFEAIAAVPVDDGITFDARSVKVEEIRKDAAYAGARVHLTGVLAGALISVQIDIGYGDAVTPGPVQSTYPTLLDNFPAPRLRTYPVYTVIAEKLHAVTVLGMTNTRMKDFLDLHVMLEREHLNSQTLAAAIAATFARRGTPPLLILPAGLSAAFAQDQSRQALWRAFANRNQLSVPPLPDLIDDLRKHLEPLLAPTRR